MLLKGWHSISVGSCTGMNPQKTFSFRSTDRITHCIPQLDSDGEAEAKAKI
jgi:hypothetical protein